MINSNLYQPFKKLQFDNIFCFLSGESLTDKKQKISVFPQWLIDSYELDKRPLKMLDESVLTYADIFLPCADATKIKLDELENTIQKAFEGGFDEVKKVDETLLFQWVAKTVYGMIFKEIQTAIKQQKHSAEGFNMSQGLIHKFGMLHQMLQSVIQPVIFENFKPFSLFICPITNSEQDFFYRDEINTLTFSLKMKNFGLLMNLQDNGANKIYHDDVCSKVNGKTLHPIQFEELCAKVFYSAYLFNRLPEYHVLEVDRVFYIEPMPLRGMISKPIFDEWQFKTYGQVLENFWKPWGFLLLEIIKNPNEPMSFLFDKSGEFVEAEKIDF